MEYPSKLIENAVDRISKFAGIGKKTALRLAFQILKEEPEFARDLAESIIELKEKSVFCQMCNSLSDDVICNLCKDHAREKEVLCVVETPRDVIAIENTNQYRGIYYVLNGIISPVEGVGPSDLPLEKLIERINNEGIKELVMALPSTMEGDTTVFYISKKLKNTEIKITTIARGIPIGGELEYADEITLGRSILARTHYNAES